MTEQHEEGKVREAVAQDHFRGAKKMISRPTDAEIIAVVAMSFMISEETAIDWLEVIDLKAERKILKRHLA